MLSPVEQEARDFLNDPCLLDQVVRDISVLGYDGEDLSKKLLFVCANSRRLPSPLACRIVSLSGSGKSGLVESISRLQIPVEIKKVSALTKQTLFYSTGEDPYELAHKLIVVAEGTGSKEAGYALRTLLSEKELVLRTVEAGRRGVVKILYGPVAYIETSTKEEMHPETASRLFQIGLDNSCRQTITAQRAIARQFEQYGRKSADGVIARHQAAQRLLGRRHVVIIPFATKIGFPTSGQLARREFHKFLSVIAAVASLKRFQRKAMRKREADLDAVIVAMEADFETALELVGDLVYRNLADRLPGRAFDVLIAARELASRTGNFGREPIIQATRLTMREVAYALTFLQEQGYIEKVQGSRGKRCIYKYAQGKDDHIISLPDAKAEIVGRAQSSSSSHRGQGSG